MAANGNVLIVGGGIAGMTLAMGLSRQGIKSEIVELSTDWTVIGVGISMQGPALRALRTVDILDRIVRQWFWIFLLQSVRCQRQCHRSGRPSQPQWTRLSRHHGGHCVKPSMRF